MAISGRPFQIDGVPIPTPLTYQFNIEDLSSEDTGRTLDGIMHKDVVGVKDTYECAWGPLSWFDAATLLNAVDGKQVVSFRYVDPRRPDIFLINDFYIGARTGAALNLNDDEATWEGIKMTFIRI